MNTLACCVIDRIDRIVTVVILLTLLVTLKPMVGLADEVSPVPKEKQQLAGKSEKDPDKMSISISVDEKKGVEIKGLQDLVKKLEGLKELKNLKDLEKIEDELQSELKGLEQLDLKVSSDLEDKEVEKLKKIASGALDVTRPWFFWVSIAPFILVFAVIFLFFYFRSRSRKETLETIRLMVENGHPVPPDLLASLSGGSRHQSISDSTASLDSNKSFLLSGLKPIFWGMGIILFFIFDRYNVEEWFIGVIFILVGLYHVTKSYLIREARIEGVAFNENSNDENSKTDKI